MSSTCRRLGLLPDIVVSGEHDVKNAEPLVSYHIGLPFFAYTCKRSLPPKLRELEVAPRRDHLLLTRNACSFHRLVTLSHFSGVVRMMSADARSRRENDPFDGLALESLVNSTSRIPSGENLAVHSSNVC